LEGLFVDWGEHDQMVKRVQFASSDCARMHVHNSCVTQYMDTFSCLVKAWLVLGHLLLFISVAVLVPRSLAVAFQGAATRHLHPQLHAVQLKQGAVIKAGVLSCIMQ
jgi:hypothetical protein